MGPGHIVRGMNRFEDGMAAADAPLIQRRNGREEEEDKYQAAESQGHTLLCDPGPEA